MYYCYKCFGNKHSNLAQGHLTEKLSYSELRTPFSESQSNDYNGNGESGFSYGSKTLNSTAQEEGFELAKNDFDTLKENIQRDCRVFEAELKTYKEDVRFKEGLFNGQIQALQVLKEEYEKQLNEKRALSNQIYSEFKDFENKIEQLKAKKIEAEDNQRKVLRCLRVEQERQMKQILDQRTDALTGYKYF